jgi:hypothetical protein
MQFAPIRQKTSLSDADVYPRLPSEKKEQALRMAYQIAVPKKEEQAIPAPEQPEPTQPQAEESDGGEKPAKGKPGKK